MLGALELAAGALAGGIPPGSLRRPQISPPVGALIGAYVSAGAVPDHPTAGAVPDHPTAGAVPDHPTSAQIGPVLG